VDLDRIDYDALAKIHGLLHDIWDAVALICLVDRPLRYTELHRNMTALADRFLSDSELTRTRHRLVRRRLVLERRGENGRKAYCISDAGRVRLHQIRLLMQIAPALDGPRA
jgi:DNA-binding HxlR family transcriptional regulator